MKPVHGCAARFRAFAPLLLGVLIVVLTRVPWRGANALEQCGLASRRGDTRAIRINIVTSAGFFIFLTALVCYLFRVKDANAAKDFVIASKRSWRSLSRRCASAARRCT